MQEAQQRPRFFVPIPDIAREAGRDQRGVVRFLNLHGVPIIRMSPRTRGVFGNDYQRVLEACIEKKETA